MTLVPDDSPLPPRRLPSSVEGDGVGEVGRMSIGLTLRQRPGTSGCVMALASGEGEREAVERRGMCHRRVGTRPALLLIC